MRSPRVGSVRHAGLGSLIPAIHQILDEPPWKAPRPRVHLEHKRGQIRLLPVQAGAGTQVGAGLRIRTAQEVTRPILRPFSIINPTKQILPS